MFKNGDRVVKYRAYDEEKYCAHGGNPIEVPLGTRGVIDSTPGAGVLYVEFVNGIGWNVSPIELRLEDPKIEFYKQRLLRE